MAAWEEVAAAVHSQYKSVVEAVGVAE